MSINKYKGNSLLSVSGILLTKQDLELANKIDFLQFNLIFLVLDENDEIDTSNITKIKFVAIIDNAKKNLE